MEEDSKRRKSSSWDDKLKIVIDDNSSSSNNNNNNNYIVPAVVTTDGNSENEGDQLLFKPPRIIPKVPLVMRNHENNKGIFDPKVVSIGPYHHGKPELQFVEKVKPMVATLFVSGNASGKNLDEFYNNVLEKVDDFRSCYVEGSTDQYTREEFANMILLDGCFILAMIENLFLKVDFGKSKYDDVTTHLGRLIWYLADVDIFNLLENQLPFPVLELLMRLKFQDDEGMKMMHSFMDRKHAWDLHIPNYKEVKVNENEKSPCHLLQLRWTKYLNEPLHILESQRHKGTNEHKFRCNYLKYYIHYLFFRFFKKNKSRCKQNMKELVYSFRSVTELKAKGIHFRPSTSLSLKAIKFKSYCFYGSLELRHLRVSQSTKQFCSNMIAYEFCSCNRDLAITSYISFMKSLIDQPGDVKELRSNKILSNKLGSDEEVVNVFKEITTFGLEDFEIYDEVKQSIEDHYNSIAKTRMAEFIHRYFSRPWTVIAFVAATSLLVLAFLQTYYTISPQSGHK